MTFFEHLRHQLRLFNPGRDRRALSSKQQITALVAKPACRNRACFDPGHLTASAIVLSPDRRRFVLVAHEKLGKWLQPGGHVEDGDATILASAAREVSEETGVILSPKWKPQLVNLDVHSIPAHGAEPEHLHFDFVFLFQALSQRTRASDESAAIAWAGLERHEGYSLDEAVLASLRRTRQFIANDGRNRLAHASTVDQQHGQFRRERP